MFLNKNSKQRGPRGLSSHGEVAIDSDYPTRLNFYQKAPMLEISIEEFEQFALDRLQVLKAIEAAQLRSRDDAEVFKQVEAVCRERMCLSVSAGSMAIRHDERRKDHISHFILRLAYCRTEDLRNWFIRYECALFKHRLNLGHKQLSKDEKDAMKAELIASYTHIPNFNFDSEVFLEVNFEDALDLVQQRRVYLRNGYAYVPAMEQIALVISEFKRRLTASLEMCAKALPRMDEDERLLPNTGKEYTTGAVAGKITADDVEPLSALFPLCMSHLNNLLRTDGHMKHGGRMQFGLFLKGIGLPMEESIVYWRRSFYKATDDEFQKKYVYNIRHNYGMEGKRADYTPYSCARIITGSQPGTGDHHGCPFRHFSPTIYDTEIQEMIQLVTGGHYQVACTKLFEITQLARARQQGRIAATAGSVETITHPNHYFEQAFNLVSAGKLDGKNSDHSSGTSTSLSQGAIGKRWRGSNPSEAMVMQE
ncbi:eukaryotic and archaeal DNA primase, large subunit-domain-containing protein [Syncephalis fuscata]|nr:eukaryotic and archaeal DNA primase, large subunit-domain-containing protein [Syncephalis fuscata]